VLLTTHSPELLNALEPEEVFWLARREGFSKAHRASDDPQVVALYKEGDLLGALWKQNLLSGAGAR
jgi:predicted ATPase